MNSFFDQWAETSPSGGMTRQAWVALALIAFLALFPGLSSVPAMDRDESRYAQASRQMMETGDFLNIKFQEYDRHKQPAGSYWLQSLFAQPFGGADAPIGAHRLPGFVFALLAVGLTAWLGGRIFSPPVGLAAGIVLATTLVLSVEAKTAKTDAILLGLGMIAQTALMILMVEIKQKRPQFWGWPALLWGALGASLLVKGPIFLMVTALTLIAFVAWKREPGLLLKVRPLPGVALALAIFVPWFVAINLATDWAFAAEAIGHSMLGKVDEAQENHSGPLGYHIVATAITFWPGFALLGLGILAAWHNRTSDSVKFLIAWIIPTYVVFEIVATKLAHYTLPSFPAIAILVGLGLSQLSELLRSWTGKMAHWATAIVAMLVASALGFAPILANRELGHELDFASYGAVGFGFLAALVIGYLALKPSLVRLAVSGLAAAGLYACVFALAMPSMDKLWTSERLARIVDQFEGCETFDVTVGGYREPSVAFNLGTNTWLAYDGADTARYLLENRACGIAIVDALWQADFDAAIAQSGMSVRELAQFEGYNSVGADPLSLTIVTLSTSSVRAPTP